MSTRRPICPTCRRGEVEPGHRFCATCLSFARGQTADEREAVAVRRVVDRAPALSPRQHHITGKILGGAE